MTATAAVFGKARRLRDEGRVRELTAARVFEVEGDSGTYLVTLASEGGWSCTCRAHGGCSHFAAAVLEASEGVAA